MGNSDVQGGFNHLLQRLPALGHVYLMPIWDIFCFLSFIFFHSLLNVFIFVFLVTDRAEINLNILHQIEGVKYDGCLLVYWKINGPSDLSGVLSWPLFVAEIQKRKLVHAPYVTHPVYYKKKDSASCWRSYSYSYLFHILCNNSIETAKQESRTSERKVNFLSFTQFLPWSNGSKPTAASRCMPSTSASPAEPGLTCTLRLIQAWHRFPPDFWMQELTTGSFDSHIQKCQRCGRNRAEHNGCQNAEVVMKIGCRLRLRKEKQSCNLLHIKTLLSCYHYKLL